MSIHTACPHSWMFHSTACYSIASNACHCVIELRGRPFVTSIVQQVEANLGSFPPHLYRQTKDTIFTTDFKNSVSPPDQWKGRPRQERSIPAFADQPGFTFRPPRTLSRPLIINPFPTSEAACLNHYVFMLIRNMTLWYAFQSETSTRSIINAAAANLCRSVLKCFPRKMEHVPRPSRVA